MSEQEGSYPDAIRSLVGAVELMAQVEAERDAAVAALERVRRLADSWEEAPERLTEMAKTRSAEGDDSLARALAIGRAYATALRVTLEEPK